jgi:tetratricopeptide (TPR) repeat protein
MGCHSKTYSHWEQVETILDEFAIDSAPSGHSFRFLDKRLSEDNRFENRCQLREQALKRKQNREERCAILFEYIAMLKEKKEWVKTLDLYRALIFDEQTTDSKLISEAFTMFQKVSTAEETARFLARMVRQLDSDEESLHYLRTLIELRFELGDHLGAEAAIRDLLTRHPGDNFALEKLSDLLRDAPKRRKEFIETLEMRRSIARHQKDMPLFQVLTHEIADNWANEGKDARVVDLLKTSLSDFPHDEKAVSRVVEIYKNGRRFRDWIAFLIERGENHPEPTVQIGFFLDAAKVTWKELNKKGRAHELLERALQIDPGNIDALRAKAELASDLGDGQGAMHALERLLSQTKEPSVRAKTHLQIGKVLEEQLLKPADALKRYAAATEEDPENEDVWMALCALSRLQNATDDLITGLHKLAQMTQSKEQSGAYLKELGFLYRDEKADSKNAENTLAEALENVPRDQEVFFELLELIASRLSEKQSVKDLKRLPTTEFLEAIEKHLFIALKAHQAAESESAQVYAFRLLVGLHYAAFGDERKAQELLTRLYEERPDDCPLLQAFSQLLARTKDQEEQRHDILERLLLHHAPSLTRPQQVGLWADVGCLRWKKGELSTGRKAIKMALAMAVEESDKAQLSDDTIGVAIEALDHDDLADTDARLLVAACQIGAGRANSIDAASYLFQAAQAAHVKLKDIDLARRLVGQSLEKNPAVEEARDLLLDLEMFEGTGDDAINAREILLATEQDPGKRAGHYVALARLVLKINDDLELATDHYMEALSACPENSSAQTELEDLYRKHDKIQTLELLYQKHLKAMKPTDTDYRVLLLERLAQLRRYELRDIQGAIESLEAIVTLQPGNVKAREDAARLYADIGNWRHSTKSWRGVLEREPVSKEAWRSMFSLYGRSGQGDATYCIAETMKAIDIADDQTLQLLRKARPPFPCWPKPASTKTNVLPILAHPLERTPLRRIFQLVGPRLQPAYGQPLKAFGLHRKKAIAERQLPSSIALAVRTASDLLGFEKTPKMYTMDSASTTGSEASFALLPAAEPGLLISREALKGGITPMRAFALGRLMIWLSPQGLLGSCVDADQLQMILNTLCQHFLPPPPTGGWSPVLPEGGRALEKVLFQGLSSAEKKKLRTDLVDALERYAHLHRQIHVTDWLAGLGYTGDRFGFFLSSDLASGVSVLQKNADQAMGVRLAIKELVLYSASEDYFKLRHDFRLALPDSQTAPFLAL